jgi:hypothetical protein
MSEYFYKYYYIKIAYELEPVTVFLHVFVAISLIILRLVESNSLVR